MSTGLQKLSEFYQPTQVCHIGYAGGTSPVMGIGKILIADIVEDQQKVYKQLLTDVAELLGVR